MLRMQPVAYPKEKISSIFYLAQSSDNEINFIIFVRRFVWQEANHWKYRPKSCWRNAFLFVIFKNEEFFDNFESELGDIPDSDEQVHQGALNIFDIKQVA